MYVCAKGCTVEAIIDMSGVQIYKEYSPKILKFMEMREVAEKGLQYRPRPYDPCKTCNSAVRNTPISAVRCHICGANIPDASFTIHRDKLYCTRCHTEWMQERN